MSDLIDRNVLLKRIDDVRYLLNSGYPKRKLNTSDVIETIRLEPAVAPEFVDRKKGHWEKRKLSALTFWVCTACEKVHYCEPPRFAHYCPGCGAKMDDEVDV